MLDVGANIGQFARYLRSMKFGGRITSFEPLPDAFRELLRTMGGDVNWNGVNSAVGATSGTIQINVSHNSVSSSIRHVEERHLEAHPDSAISRVETVQLVSLNEYLIQNPDSVGPYMLKADTQGFEDAVLDGANLPGWPIPLVVLEMSIEPLYRG